MRDFEVLLKFEESEELFHVYSTVTTAAPDLLARVWIRKRDVVGEPPATVSITITTP